MVKLVLLGGASNAGKSTVAAKLGLYDNVN